MTPEDDLIEILEETPNAEKVDVKKELAHYRNVLSFMGANVPVEVLCLPQSVITILHKHDIVRVYDLIDHSLDGIKGLGKNRIDLIRARCDEFFSVTL